MSYFPVDKDPDAVLDYSIVWCDRSGINTGSNPDAGWLQGDTITTSTWVVSGPDNSLIVENDLVVDFLDGVTIVSTDTIATVWLSGGTLNRDYTVVNHIVTAQGREDDRTIVVSIVQK